MQQCFLALMMGTVAAMGGCNSHVAGGVDIWQAVKKDDAAGIAIYAASGGNLNVLNSDGSTPLWVALDNGHREAYESLLEYGADPNVIMSGKRVVTHWAASGDDSWWLRLALEHGANPNLINVGNGRPSEGTPLHFAIGNGELSETDVALENVKLLLDHGADINKRDRYDCDPLADAAAQNRFRITLYLLKQGADFRHSQRSGITFIENIRKKCENKTRWFLLQKDRDELSAICVWLEEHGVSIDEK